MWVNHYGGITAHYDPKVSDYPLFTANTLTQQPGHSTVHVLDPLLVLFHLNL